MPQAWYDAEIGVRVHMLGGEETALFTGRPPVRKTIRNRRLDPDGTP